MAELETKTETIDKTDSNNEKPTTPGKWMLVFGVFLPSFVVVFELFTRMCADAFFDPLPTLGHVPLTLSVPAANFWLWRSLRSNATPSPWLPLAGGAAIAISLFYALWFLPLLPMAVIAVIMFGLGLLPFGPVFGFIVAGRLAIMVKRRLGTNFARRAWAGGAIGVVALILLDMPSAATLLALRWAAEGGEAATKAVTLMRAIGDRDQLLMRCHNINRPVVGPLSAALSDFPLPFARNRALMLGIDQGTARELYYRVTGKSYTAAPPSFGQWRGEQADGFVFDEDQGGTEVGQRVAGLTLNSSRLDGSIHADDAVANIEWTMELANATKLQQETRLTLELPPGAVASRATLWVNGEPREASFGSRSATRAAYENVVKRQRRDPLLVTTSGADRLLVQAFPIEPGKAIKLRIGMSVPMTIPTTGRPTVVLPAIVDRNFVIDGQLQHLVWIDSATEVVSSVSAIAAKRADNGIVQLRGSLTDEQLAQDRPRLSAPSLNESKTSFAHLPAPVSKSLSPEYAGTITQSIVREAVVVPQHLMLVVDGSVGARSVAKALQDSIDALPSQAIVGLIIAGEPATRIEPAPVSAEQKKRMRQAWQATHFRGGHDNAEALAQALEWLSEKPQSALIWIHGPQPIAFANSTAHLEQLLERSRTLPQLLMYQVTAGPNKILGDHHWFGNTTTFPASKDSAGDLRELFATVYSPVPRWTVHRTLSHAKAEAGANGDAIARVWAAQRVRELLAHETPKRDEALKLAMGVRIVTPVSGAVVLEADADYKAQGLPVPGTDVLQVPEPSPLSLLAIGIMCLILMVRRRRVSGVV